MDYGYFASKLCIWTNQILPTSNGDRTCFGLGQGLNVGPWGGRIQTKTLSHASCKVRQLIEMLHLDWPTSDHGIDFSLDFSENVRIVYEPEKQEREKSRCRFMT